VDQWLDRNDRQRIAESYRRAYRAHPLTSDELAALTNAALALVEREGDGSGPASR
jgi:hypothetical protein